MCSSDASSFRDSPVRPHDGSSIWFSTSLAVEDLHEGLPELNIEGGVDDGVDGTVDVAEPRKSVVHGLGDVAVTVHVQNVGDEEREPADDEDTCRGEYIKRDGLARQWKK